MKEDYLDERLEQLLTTTPFGKLTTEEKSYALNFLSEKEYKEYHFVLSASQKAMLSNYDSIQPLPKALQTLKKRFADKSSDKKQHIAIFTKPLYLSLIAAAVLFIIISLFINLPSGNQTFTGKKVNALPIDSSNKTQPLAKITTTPITESKTAYAPQPVYKSRKALVHTIVKKTHKLNLCMDIEAAPTYSMIADTLSRNTPGLTTMPIMPANTNNRGINEGR